MLSSASGQGELLATGLKFVNSFLDSADSAQKRLYIQAELEQAGFDASTIKKVRLVLLVNERNHLHLHFFLAERTTKYCFV